MQLFKTNTIMEEMCNLGWRLPTGDCRLVPIFANMYRILRSILFLFPAEGVHYFSMNILKAICSLPPLRKLVSSIFTPSSRKFSDEKHARLTPHPPSQGYGGQSASRPTHHSLLTTHYFNLEFRNPIGLGAGFDKNARYLRELKALGFGFVEIGTVTPLPQEGNPKPRLFRLPKDKALINRMGFNNDGVMVIAKRLRNWNENLSAVRNRQSGQRLIIGGNIGKNKSTPNEEAWKDYEICFKELHSHVDYFVVNVSSPNTPGLRELQEKDSLRKILRHLQMINNGKAHAKPILLKISPDLSTGQLNDVIDLAMEIRLDGIVAANTTIERGDLRNLATAAGETGGLSGLPLQRRSTEIVRYIQQRTSGHLPVIASGGIFNAANVKEKLDAGASLVQVWTGFIYEGPSIVKKICKTLNKL